MLVAAVLGAKNGVFALFGGGEPHLVEASGHDIKLQPKGWDEKAVDDIFRAHHQFDGLAFRDMQLGVNDAGWVGEIPVPLLAGDLDLQGIAGGVAHVEVAADAKIENKDDQNGRDDGPGQLEPRVVGAGDRRLTAFRAAVAPDKAHHQGHNDEHKKDTNGHDEIKEPVGLGRCLRGLGWEPKALRKPALS